MTSGRLIHLDALRGFAMVWMTVYHFFFDLNHFKLFIQDFYRDPFWTWQRSAIVGIFLFCSGFAQSVAVAQIQSQHQFWRRWLQIGAAASLVSLASWWMFPASWIYFGVLHAICIMMLIVRAALIFPRWRYPALAGMIMVCLTLYFLMPSFASKGLIDPIWDQKWLNGIGWINKLPITQDYVPLIPWLGIVAFGALLGLPIMNRHPQFERLKFPSTSIGRAMLGKLALLGRWSLSYYLMHQPVLMAVLSAWVFIFR